MKRKSWVVTLRKLPSWQWRLNRCDGVSNHRRLDCLLNSLFMRRSKKTSKLRATGLCEGNSPVMSEFPAQRASNAGNVSIWWRHHHHWLRWNLSFWQLPEQPVMKTYISVSVFSTGPTGGSFTLVLKRAARIVQQYSPENEPISYKFWHVYFSLGCRC